ncbi:MAG: hypothetical protein H6636_13550 [Anaerolineales bacterium]|nr:hypothetical protein [Anaerolineales bacterium]
MLSKKWYVAGGTLVAILAVTTIAYAAHTTINTNNGQVDANWSNVSALSNDGDDIANNNYDIDQAWVANASDNSAFYFRVSMVGTGQLPHNYSSFEARLDCNQNFVFNDSVDVVVYYAIEDGGIGEELVECQGNQYFECDYDPEPNGADTNANTFGEEIAGAPYNYEWRADVNNGEVDWSQCFGTINVQFLSLDDSFATQDTTLWRSYNVPTAIELHQFTAQPSRNLNIVGMIAIPGLILLVVSGFIWWILHHTNLR